LKAEVGLYFIHPRS